MQKKKKKSQTIKKNLDLSNGDIIFPIYFRRLLEDSNDIRYVPWYLLPYNGVKDVKAFINSEVLHRGLHSDIYLPFFNIMIWGENFHI